MKEKLLLYIHGSDRSLNFKLTSTPLVKVQIHTVDRLNPTPRLFNQRRLCCDILSDNSVALEACMQAFSANVHRGTKVTGGATGRDSSRGRAQHNWARRGNNEGGIGGCRGGERGVDSGGRGRGQTRPRLTHCTTFNYIRFPPLTFPE